MKNKWCNHLRGINSFSQMTYSFFKYPFHYQWFEIPYPSCTEFLYELGFIIHPSSPTATQVSLHPRLLTTPALTRWHPENGPPSPHPWPKSIPGTSHCCWPSVCLLQSPLQVCLLEAVHRLSCYFRTAWKLLVRKVNPWACHWMCSSRT